MRVHALPIYPRVDNPLGDEANPNSLRCLLADDTSFSSSGTFGAAGDATDGRRRISQLAEVAIYSVNW